MSIVFFLLTLIAIVIPICFIVVLKKIMEKPHNISVIKKFGFLFLDFKDKFTYWEFISALKVNVEYNLFFLRFLNIVKNGIF